MSEEEKKTTGKIDISKTIESNIDYWRNKCFEQQKEIEELNLQNIELKQQKIIDNCSIPTQKNFNEYYNYISKDKIRELIKEKAKTDTYNFKTVAVKDIEELLEEGKI